MRLEKYSLMSQSHATQIAKGGECVKYIVASESNDALGGAFIQRKKTGTKRDTNVKFRNARDVSSE